MAPADLPPPIRSTASREAVYPLARGDLAEVAPLLSKVAYHLKQRGFLDPVKRGRDGRGLSSALLKFHEAEEGAGVGKGEGDFLEAAVTVNR